MPPNRMLFPCEQNPDLAHNILGWTAIFPSFASCLSLCSSHPCLPRWLPRGPLYGSRLLMFASVENDR